MDGKVQLESFLNVAQQLICNDVCKIDNKRSWKELTIQTV